MTIYELLLSDGRVIPAPGDTGRDAAMRYVDRHQAEIVDTGTRVLSWRLPALDRYVPKSERDDFAIGESVVLIAEPGEPGR